MNPLPHFLIPLIFTVMAACHGNLSPDTKMPEERVLAAENDVGPFLKAEMEYKKFEPGNEVFLRAFKEERILELWMRPDSANEFRLFKSYSICAASGHLGRKLKQGDFQVPEGFYHIDRFNPQSNFHLSMGINYPNDADRFVADKTNPGGDIFIHGSCHSVGCLAMTDDLIKEIYLLCNWAKNAGQQKIEVHIFPFEMTDTQMNIFSSPGNEKRSFWENLREGYDYFQRHKKLPSVAADNRGHYIITS